MPISVTGRNPSVVLADEAATHGRLWESMQDDAVVLVGDK